MNNRRLGSFTAPQDWIGTQGQGLYVTDRDAMLIAGSLISGFVLGWVLKG